MDKLDVDERFKISTLQKEKRDATSGINWMYTGNKPDSEDYLLGKRIDKHVEGEQEKKTDDASAIFGERIKANIALDVAAKMREDPLFAIRRKEEESRKKLLENPIKMKELQKLIEQQEKQKKEKEKKKKKKHKKHKKSGDAGDSSMMS
ncbi:RNA-splicing factor [Bulinus truncatus]|nr:RNA-splicing factor [Bulinus truncatus]